jgi:hypothetical protein
MTLPTDTNLPYRSQDILSGDPLLMARYMRDLVDTLEDNYQKTVEVVNGNLRQWTPIVIGTATAGIGTYAHQTGWLSRSGIYVDLWMDVEWSAHTGTGNLAIQLPYRSARSSNEPWGCGALQVSNITFTAGYTYLVWKAEQNTFQGTIVQCGSGVAASGLAIPGSGALVGHLRYVGQEFENQ